MFETTDKRKGKVLPVIKRLLFLPPVHMNQRETVVSKSLANVPKKCSEQGFRRRLPKEIFQPFGKRNQIVIYPANMIFVAFTGVFLYSSQGDEKSGVPRLDERMSEVCEILYKISQIMKSEAHGNVIL